jgi:hypothetical protein
MTTFRILLIIVFTFLTILIFGYIDYNILTPLLPLPDDICFYHTNTPPTWVRLFYLDSSGHTEPPFGGLHIMTLFAFSFITSIYLSFKTEKWLKRIQNTKNKQLNQKKH